MPISVFSDLRVVIGTGSVENLWTHLNNGCIVGFARTEAGKWRRERDSNPRCRYKRHTRFPVVLLQPTRTSLRMTTHFFVLLWRKGRDSNSRRVAPHCFSRAAPSATRPPFRFRLCAAQVWFNSSVTPMCQPVWPVHMVEPVWPVGPVEPVCRLGRLGRFGRLAGQISIIFCTSPV